MASLGTDRLLDSSVTRNEFTRSLAALLVFLLPVVYAACLASTIVHEVLGHGLAAIAFGGRFHGFVMSWNASGTALFDGVERHEWAVHAAGVVVSLAVGLGTVLLAANSRRPLLGIVYAVVATMLLERSVAYAALGSFCGQGPSDFGRIADRAGGPGSPVQIGLSIGWGLAWPTASIACLRVLVLRIEGLLGPLVSWRAVAVFGSLVGGSFLLFWPSDSESSYPGLGRLPVFTGMGLNSVVLAALLFRRRHSVDPLGAQDVRWPCPLITAWVGSAACVAAVLPLWGSTPEELARRVKASSAEALQQHVDELRAAGRPTTPRELVGPDPSDAENAAPELQAALDAIRARFGPESNWPRAGPWSPDSVLLEDETPERVAEVRQFLASLGPYFQRIAKALDRPRCRFPLTGPDGFEDGKGTSTVQSLSRLLGAQALVASEPAARVEAVRTLLQLARRNEPAIVIDWMVGSSMAVLAANRIRAGIESGSLDLSETRADLDGLLRYDWIERGPKWLVANVMETVAMGRSVYEDEDDDPWRVRNSDALVDGLRQIDAFARIVPSGPAEYLRSAVALQQRLEAVGSTDAFVASLGIRSLVRADAATRLARVALAVAERHARTGAYPASLDDLAAEFGGSVPLDPFTDAPLLYERIDDGVRIASLGRLPEEKPSEDDDRRDRALLWELRR